MSKQKRLILFVSGLSGAGKTTTLTILNDIHYYTIDNFPLSMIEQFFNQLPDDNKPIALGVSIQTINFNACDLLKIIDKYKLDYDIRLLFLKANSNTLHKRYSLTSMTHPLCQDGNLDKAIQAEYALYIPIIEAASLLIETDDMGPKDLKRQLMRIFNSGNQSKPVLIINSFGFKYGIPRDAETIFDARILKNPHWHQELAKLTGQDKQVQDFLHKDSQTDIFINSIITYINKSVLPFLKNDKSFYHIAIGCTGGRHRSVYSVEKIYEYLKDNHIKCQLDHRDI
jgi:UPF0042 nucleotide-binding protein